MSFDPFEIRLQFLGLLRKLTAAQQSIQLVVSFAVKHANKCSEDLWDCIVEECAKGTLNSRINILYFLDTLCDPMICSVSGNGRATFTLKYPAYLTRDVLKIVDLVVPSTREGTLNLLSAKQIIDSWRARRMIPQDLADSILFKLEERRSNPSSSIQNASASTSTSTTSSLKRPHPTTQFTRQDTLRRMDEDRERHKRLRERMWVLPIPGPSGGGGGGVTGAGLGTASPLGTSPAFSPFTPGSPSTLASLARTQQQQQREESSLGDQGGQGEVLALNPMDLDFEQTWDSAEVFGEEDWEMFKEQANLATNLSINRAMYQNPEPLPRTTVEVEEAKDEELSITQTGAVE